jgi:hypothetical protein
MARREITVVTDDVTGKETDEATTEIICVEGVAYELDMSPETLTAYRKAIEPYRSAGRRIGRTSSGGNVLRPIGFASSTPARVDKEQNKAVREWWGRNQGRDGLPPLVERGRIPQPVLDLFQKHKGRAIEEAPDVPPRSTRPRKAAAPTFSSPEPVSTPVSKAAKPARKTTAAARVGTGSKGHDTAASRARKRVAAN